MLSQNESVHSLLTADIKRYIFSRKWPSGLEIRLADKGSYIYLILFRDNMLAMDGEDLTQIAAMVNEALSKIRADGIPIFLHVEKRKDQDA